MKARKINTANGTASVESARMRAPIELIMPRRVITLNSAFAMTMVGTIWPMSSANSTGRARRLRSCAMAKAAGVAIASENTAVPNEITKLISR